MHAGSRVRKPLCRTRDVNSAHGLGRSCPCCGPKWCVVSDQWSDKWRSEATSSVKKVLLECPVLPYKAPPKVEMHTNGSYGAYKGFASRFKGTSTKHAIDSLTTYTPTSRAQCNYVGV